jgi:preprotein translocase subunit YajC
LGSLGFLLIIVAFAFLYFVLVRPQKRRQLQQQQMLNDINVGDEIVTAGGLLGEVREVRDEELLVRIAPELDVRIARRAVVGVTPEHDEDDDEEPVEDENDDAEEQAEPEEPVGKNGPSAAT